MQIPQLSIGLIEIKWAYRMLGDVINAEKIPYGFSRLLFVSRYHDVSIWMITTRYAVARSRLSCMGHLINMR